MLLFINIMSLYLLLSPNIFWNKTVYQVKIHLKRCYTSFYLHTLYIMHLAINLKKQIQNLLYTIRLYILCHDELHICTPRFATRSIELPTHFSITRTPTSQPRINNLDIPISIATKLIITNRWRDARFTRRCSRFNIEWTLTDLFCTLTPDGLVWTETCFDVSSGVVCFEAVDVATPEVAR